MRSFTRKWRIALIAFLFIHGIASAQFQMQTIKNSGSTATKVNIVILGDGYTSSQQSKFWSDAQNVTTGVFNTYPFNGSISTSYNVFAVGVISQASGAGASPSQPVNNYFGSTFYADGVTQRLLYPSNLNLVFSTAAQYVPDYDQVIVMVNTSTYGGAGGAAATISTHTDAINLFVHEFGHSFGSLQDEYWNGNPNETYNMTRSGSNPRWSSYIGQSGIGVYPYEENTSWYRPHQNCKMRYLAGGFCLVCSNRLIEKTNSIAGGGGGGCTSAPAVPSGLAASGQTVSWNSVSGATSYTLQRWNGSSWVTAATPTTNQATLSLTGTYYFMVSATNACGTSANSSYVSLTLGSGCTTAPSTPTNLTASGRTISWSAVSGAASYTLQRWTGSAWVTAATPTTNSATLTLTAGGYYFKVSATNSCGTSSYSPYAYLTLTNPAPYANEEGITNGVSFYPNPTKDKVHIINPFKKEAEVRIYTLSGALVGKDKLPMTEGVVDISHLNNGQYVFHLIHGSRKAPAFRVVKD